MKLFEGSDALFNQPRYNGVPIMKPPFSTAGYKPDDPIFADQADVDSVFGIKAPALTEAAAIDAIVASQKAAGDPIDPNGARKLVRALIAVGLFKPA